MSSIQMFSIGNAANIIGVCTKTLRRWETKNLFLPDMRTKGGHRRYSRTRLYEFFKNRFSKFHRNFSSKDAFPLNKKAAIYARVSSTRQKTSGDLERQVKSIEEYCRERSIDVIKIYTDIGSGLNDTRKGLIRLLRDIPRCKFDTIVVNYPDRLARFSLQIIREFIACWDISLIIIHPTAKLKGEHAELITDLTSILYSFMGKLYRMRRHEKLKPEGSPIEVYSG